MPGRAEWLIKALHETANEIGDLFDVRASDARRHPQAGEWSILEVVAHLRDRETVAASHLEQLLLTAGSRLRLHEQEWCDPDPQPARNLGQALYAFGAQRRRTVTLLWAMGPEAWERGAQHPYRGWVTVHEIATDLHEHDLEHLWQGRRLREALGPSRSPARRISSGAEESAPGSTGSRQAGALERWPRLP